MIKLVGEIGINHNGDIDTAVKLIKGAAFAGFHFVKFQKRSPDVCVPEEQKNVPRQTPWGEMTYIEYKHRMEFGAKEYDIIDEVCQSEGVRWFASAWDLESADFLAERCDIVKIPSAHNTNMELMEKCKKDFAFRVMSTGMATESNIIEACKVLQPQVIMHSVGSYPTDIGDTNLDYIRWLKDNYSDCEIGYSGHEYGLTATMCAVAFGATWIERHITLDRHGVGSDHKSSLDPEEMIRLTKKVNLVSAAITGYGAREILPSEIDKVISLRGGK